LNIRNLGEAYSDCNRTLDVHTLDRESDIPDGTGEFMANQHGAAAHHASAAAHHNEAARYHREASRHYLVGKDYAHAAHQALVAHGHALHAVGRGHEANKYYLQNDRNAPVKPAEPPAGGTSPGKMAAIPHVNSAKHHAAAADRHHEAMEHHGLARSHCDERDYELAAHEARIAHSHAEAAVFHGEEAAMHHVEHYGKSGAIAEIA
jgi:hypothetical protein